MTKLRSMLGSVFLITSATVLGQTGSQAPVIAKSTDGSVACNLGSLPSDVRERLKADFGTWKVQAQESLSEHARKTWEGKKPQACPGIAVGLFQSAKTPSYAVLLVPVDHPDDGYRFLVFGPKAEQSVYETTVVEKSDDHGASNYFIRKASISRFFNEESKKKFQVQAADAILMVDSGETEYEADLYFWSNGRFQQQPVDE
jgi:hypothetical protein